MIRIVNCWIIEQILTGSKVIASQSSSARVNTFDIIHNIKVVAEQVLQITECLGWKDKDMGVLIQLICSCQEEQLAVVECRRQTTPQSTAPVTRLIDTKSLLQVTPYHGDKASFLGWEWSFLIAVRAISKPLYEGLEKIEDNMNQDFRKSRLSIEGLEVSDQAYTLLALLCIDDACACVRSAEDGNGYQA